MTNNCFDVAINFLNHFGFRNSAKLVKKRKSYYIEKGIGVASKTLLGVFLFALSAVVKIPISQNHIYALSGIVKGIGQGAGKIATKLLAN